MAKFKAQMLWENIEKGDLSAVHCLLESGNINLEERNETGQTFLMVASENGELNIVRELLEAGVDANAVDNDNWSALLCAAKEGHLEIVIELLERDASIEHRDMCGWTPLMWASYKGRVIVVQELLEKGANPNIKAEHNMTPLAWASGRGHTEIVQMLLEKGAKANAADKYGTTPLIWASRKGYLEIVDALLAEGGNADASGMNSWTPLLVATKGGFTEVVQSLLKYDPNINAVDKDGMTALAIAAKEGFVAIVSDLLAQGAYVNIADRASDTILIHAVKGGFIEIVRSLLSRHVDIDVEGAEGKTALYWAVEKGHTRIVNLLLDQDPDLEVCTKDNDTALLRAVRSRNDECVRLLMEKGAKVSAADKRGDTPLHIAIRARSKKITEILLRNPRNSRLLYRPNKAGETPYKMDSCFQKSILTQIFGHRNLNASDAENLLGYEIYSSALADILSEPALITPISVGLYAKWGSGKSFLLEKLKKEMKLFTYQNIMVDDNIKFGWVLFLLLLFINLVIGETLSLTVRFEVGLSVGFGLFPLEYAFLGIIQFCKKRYNFPFAVRLAGMISRKLHLITLFLQMLFCIPKRISSQEKLNFANGLSYSVRFLFSDCTRLTSVGGEKSLAAMIATLCVAVEQEYGLLVTRLFRVFKPQFGNSKKASFKCMCCVPYFVIVLIIFTLIAASIALVTIFKVSNIPVNGILISFICVIGLSFITNVYTWAQATMALLTSQKKRVVKAAEQVGVLKMDGFMQKLKTEVDMMSTMVNCMDAFTERQTRLVVIVDGLDSCEQEKVLQVLDTVNSLFSDDNSPYIVVLAVDPHIIIKGIEQNLTSRFDSNVNGYDYLRNVVHLPFYLQSQGVRIPKQDLTAAFSSETSVNHNESPGKPYVQHQDSVKSSTSIDKGLTHKKVKSKMSSILSESLPGITYASSVDLSNTFVKNDYFSDINPRSMRRLMNIVSVTARLLRAYHVEFNWHRLAAWINIIEQWPYRVSWIIYYFEENDGVDNATSLHAVYQKISPRIPASKDIDPLLEIDRNVRKLEAFLASKSGNYPLLNIGDLRKFLGCTINLDPYLRKLIREFHHNTEIQRSMDYGGVYSQPQIQSLNSRDSEANLLRYSGKSNAMLNTPTRLPMNTAYTNPMMQYGGMMPNMMPNMMPVPMMPPQAVNSVASWPTTRPPPQVFLTDYNNEFHLSQMSVIDICLMLEKLSGVNQSMITEYATAIRENNITGLVLANCDIDELGKVMEMKFGDWQLFKAAILSLRDAELQPPEQAIKATGKFSDGVLYGKGRSPYDPDRMPQNGSDTEGNNLQRRTSTGTSRKQSFSSVPQQRSPPKDDLSPVKPRMKRNDSIVQQLSLETAILREALEEFTEEGLIEEMDGPEKSTFNISSDDEGMTNFLESLDRQPRRSMSYPTHSSRSRSEAEPDEAESDIVTVPAVIESPSTSHTETESHISLAKTLSTSIDKLTKPIVQAMENRQLKKKKADTIPLVDVFVSSSSSDHSPENGDKNYSGKGSRSGQPAVLTIESDDKPDAQTAMKSEEDKLHEYFRSAGNNDDSKSDNPPGAAGTGNEYFL